MSEQALSELTATDELADHVGATEVPAEDLLVEEVSIDGMCGVY